MLPVLLEFIGISSVNFLLDYLFKKKSEIPYHMSKLVLFLVTYLGLHSLAFGCFGSFRYLTLDCKHL